MRRPLLSLCFFFLLPAAAATAQKKQGQARLDSLLSEAPKMKEDTNGVNLADYISFAYQAINPDECLKWAAKELAFAQKAGWRKGEAMACNNFALYYTDRGDYPAALNYLHKGQSIIEALGNKRMASEIMLGMGTIYFYQKNYTAALSSYFKSLDGATLYGDDEWRQQVFTNIGAVYSAQGKAKEGIGYLEKALKIAEARGDKAGILLQTGNMASAYANARQFSKAIAYDFKALRAAEEIGDKLSAAINLGNIGANYFNVARFNVAQHDSLVYTSRAANLAQGVGYLERGIAACRELHYDRGATMFTAALSAAKALEKNIRLKSDTH